MRAGRGSGTATLVFTDLVGSTELLSSLGEAAFDEVRRTHFAVLRDAIERTGGAPVGGGDSGEGGDGSATAGTRFVLQRDIA